MKVAVRYWWLSLLCAMQACVELHAIEMVLIGDVFELSAVAMSKDVTWADAAEEICDTYLKDGLQLSPDQLLFSVYAGPISTDVIGARDGQKELWGQKIKNIVQKFTKYRDNDDLYVEVCTVKDVYAVGIEPIAGEQEALEDRIEAFRTTWIDQACRHYFDEELALLNGDIQVVFQNEDNNSVTVPIPFMMPLSELSNYLIVTYRDRETRQCIENQLSFSVRIAEGSRYSHAFGGDGVYMDDVYYTKEDDISLYNLVVPLFRLNYDHSLKSFNEQYPLKLRDIVITAQLSQEDKERIKQKRIEKLVFVD